jgi:hypothetical protein
LEEKKATSAGWQAERSRRQQVDLGRRLEDARLLDGQDRVEQAAQARGRETRPSMSGLPLERTAALVPPARNAPSMPGTSG